MVSPLVSHFKLNYQEDTNKTTGACYQSFLLKEHLPEKFDISPRGPAIWDQGTLGSCTSHGVSRAVSFAAKQYAKSQGKEDLFSSRPSRLFNYSTMRMDIGVSLTEDSGGTVRDAFRAVANHSVPDETLWEYKEENFYEKPPTKAFEVAEKFSHFAYMKVAQTEIGIKQAIFNGFPVVFGFKVYDSFMAHECADTGIVPLPKNGENFHGGHCVTIVGWDDKDKCFLIANSWGTKVGLPKKRGYFKFPYAFILDKFLSTDFWICKLFH